jgi:hypothetical protein
MADARLNAVIAMGMQVDPSFNTGISQMVSGIDKVNASMKSMGKFAGSFSWSMPKAQISGDNLTPRKDYSTDSFNLKLSDYTPDLGLLSKNKEGLKASWGSIIGGGYPYELFTPKNNKGFKVTQSNVADLGSPINFEWPKGTSDIAPDNESKDKKASSGLQNLIAGTSNSSKKLTDSQKKAMTNTNMLNKLTQKSIGVNLSLLFTGMSLDRMFGGLVKKGMDLVGIMDIIDAIVSIVMLPIMLSLLPIFLGILSWVTKLDNQAKLFIGALIIVGMVIGIVIMTLGQVLLLVVSTIGMIITLFSGTLIAAGASLATIIGVVLISFIAIVLQVAIVIMVIISLIYLFVYFGDTIKAVINSFLELSHNIISFLASLIGIQITAEPMKLATGGIVTSPTLALVGEKGPEAVIPLGSGGFGGSTTNNLYITNTISNEVDMEYVTRRIDRYMRNQNTFGAYS